MLRRDARRQPLEIYNLFLMYLICVCALFNCIYTQYTYNCPFRLQILLWANTSVDACHQPYDWACGKFESDHYEHSMHGVFGGEWNVKAQADYDGNLWWGLYLWIENKCLIEFFCRHFGYPFVCGKVAVFVAIVGTNVGEAAAFGLHEKWSHRQNASRLYHAQSHQYDT